MKSKTHVTIVIVSLILAACNMGGENGVTLPDNLNTELKTGDTYYFTEPKTQRTDSFKIKVTHTTEAWSEWNSYKDVFVMYVQTNRDKSMDSLLTAQFTNIKTYETLVKASVSNGFDYLSNDPTTDMSYSNAYYRDVYKLTNEENKGNAYPVTIYFNIKNGLIQYDYLDGRKFIRVKK